MAAILAELERLPDNTEDIRPHFIQKKGAPGHPIHWIAILRIIRMGISFKEILMENYDTFVNTYQTLTGRNRGVSEDEKNLLTEIGGFLYSVDELLGDHERDVTGILEMVHQGLLEEYGTGQDDIEEDFYRARMNRETMKRAIPRLDEHYAICYRFARQLDLRDSLERMRKLIMDRKARS